MSSNTAPAALDELTQVLETLIGPDGCPWDREQTPESLCDYVLEEAFELVDAIRSGNAADVREELGDVMFLMAFIGRLYQDRAGFSLEDAVADVAAKMVRRHPHVFDEVTFRNKEEQLKAWEAIKRGEKSDADGRPKGVFDSLPAGLPPLLKAYRLHSKAARVGFTWPDDSAVERQVDSERREWEEALQNGDKEQQEAEFGDYLFSLVELGRRKGIKANAAIAGTNARFLRRFEAMEALCRQRGLDFPALSFEEKDALWNEVKQHETCR
ncbi:MazG family protein [Oleidesulfovibrio alaskensis G20]|jgi:ATP diphosphatase|uniref:MazG family protein n=1 Tax=Oleidesulfovibrio alaskensis (strain ATCC BAA-1058 / DSM 17464 / G20) TaxID=207559 RepID=Q30YJ6_OLEA2|nr:nucleoside triphosphate pyrophosphohydrolase [Oleidesulfovibrio alaskensis]ABB39250.1 MazG family protein [Oleidesulfovibrio alaskensis G20]MBG0771995.1 nucleoside triphosphate pyrophosphohydrolase [Oleidesulfovibrio alaskensis]MBL3581767.1 nucleoside triphosphate pyrophosphohydrolase [Oleidesulfovibrio alaskensis]